MNYYLGLDVGGTSVKCGIIDETGNIMFDRIFSFNAQSYADKDTIISNFTAIFKDLVGKISDSEINIKAIGLAFPGPFDYENGISLIKGIGKYDSIYNINLREEFFYKIREDKYLSSLMDKELKILFMHDIAAFALGEIFYGKGLGYNRIIHLCIGTGAGSAFSIDRRLVGTGEGVPENGWIYNTKFKDSIIDDYISARGLASIADQYFNTSHDGKKLYNMAVKQDETALLVFKKFGQNLYEAFTPFINGFKADCIILGGEIVRSFKFFGRQIEEFCKTERVDIRLTHNTSKSTLLGLYRKLSQSRSH